MKKYIFFITAFWIVFMGTAVAQAATTSSISQYGITWNFSRAVKYGTFANGDYWVVHPVTITSITPAQTSTDNGCMVNPGATDYQAFDSEAGAFDKTKMISLPFSSSGSQIQSIVKSVSDTVEKGSPYLQTVAVLTILLSTPPDNGAYLFRPAYAGTDKTFFYTTNLLTDNLATYTTVDKGSSFSYLERMYRYPQIEIGWQAVVRRLRPIDNMSYKEDPDTGNYAPFHAGTLNKAIAKLSSNETLSAKSTLLTYVVQAGIDTWGCAKSGQIWNGGGMQPGHKLIVAFAGMMLNEQDFKKMTNKTFWWENLYHYEGTDGGGLWGRARDVAYYWEKTIGSSSTNYDSRDPYGYIDGGANWGKLYWDGYQGITQNNTKGAACWLKVYPEMQDYWSDSDTLISYAERMTLQGTKYLPDPCGPPNADDVGKKDEQWTYYGRAWGSNGSGDCIKGGGAGRFKGSKWRNELRDGYSIDSGSYPSSQMNEIWDLYHRGEQPSYGQEDQQPYLQSPPVAEFSKEVSAPKNMRIIQ